MDSLKSIPSEYSIFKKKICLLGGQELIKNEFQRKMSSSCLSIQNKNNIGVNLSKVDLIHENHYIFEYYLWNIHCGKEKAFIRGTYYPGTEAVIVLISENKVDQIFSYFNEIKANLPVVNLVFSIVLKDRTIEDIEQTYFKNQKFKNFRKEENIIISKTLSPKQIFGQISTFLLDNIKQNKTRDNFAIAYTPFNIIVNNKQIDYSCDEYYESSYISSYSRRINTSSLKKVLEKLDIEINDKNPDYINIFNDNFGTFSIFLRNGNVYFSPINCQGCKDKRCVKSGKKKYFICITNKTKGWSNIRGLDQKELLILSKIITLMDADKNNLPESILDQINKISYCPKEKSKM